MSVTAFIRRCLDAGMPFEMAMTAAEAFEAEQPVYVQETPNKNAERSRRYRQRGGGNIHPTLRQAVLERDGFTCLDCGADDRLECDHVQPVSKGGETTLENLQTLCRPCNAKKRDRFRKFNSRTISDNLGHSRNDEPLPLPPSSPTPPSSTNPNQVPPIVPQKPNAAFARFWEAYPTKVAKRAAERAFPNALRRIAGSDPVSVMLAGIDRAKRSRKWREGFIPNPATWLNGDCWDDDPDGALAKQARPLPTPEPAVYAAHVRHYRDTGEWKPAWGDKPDLESAA